MSQNLGHNNYKQENNYNNKYKQQSNYNKQNNYKQENNKQNINYNVVEDLQDYMFTSQNLARFTKDILSNLEPVNISNIHEKMSKIEKIVKTKSTADNNIYKPLKKDSLFWCFYILKYGYSKYEMEVGSQYFTVEKTEKFKYIELLRCKENKDLLKINKIKPLSELEDDLANKERISIRTFFALCIIEKLNILLVDKRKIYQSMNNDSPSINVIHRNSQSYEHYIELNVNNESITNFKETYYNVIGFDDTLKSMTSYKVDELLTLCKKLNIVTELEPTLSASNNTNSKIKKLTKKDIYELLVKSF